MKSGLYGFFFCWVFSASAVAVPLLDAEPEIANESRWAQLYERECTACHGENGDGKSRARHGLEPPPRDFTTAAAWQELTRERMITSITHGRPGTAMIAWENRLSPAEIEGITDYIRSAFMHPPETIEVHAGEPIYKEHCVPCHGDNGNGAKWTENGLNPPPRDFTSPASRQELTAERMVTSVTHGRPGTAMMSFTSRLSASEIDAVVDYIRSAFMTGDSLAQQSSNHVAGMPRHGHGAATTRDTTPVTPPPPPIVEADMSLPFPHGLAGDAEKGQHFFNENCFVCHGKKGDGSGPRSGFIHPKPRNFLSSVSRLTLNRPALFKAISQGKTGTVMPAWSKVLDSQEIANVAEYVYVSFITANQTEAGEAVSPTPAVDEQKKKDHELM